MRTAYVEMIGGAAGDMLLAAFLDAGADCRAIEAALRSVVPEGWTLAPGRVTRRGIAATYANLVVPGEDGDAAGHQHRDEAHGHHHHAEGRALRSLADVLQIVERSGLTERQRTRAAAVYRRLAEAEAKVHGTTADAIHFHEVGQIDAILDVAATCVALDLLEIDDLRCSPFPIGHGSIHMDHGHYPNPPPATAELLRGWPTRSVDVAGELVTTTAAAILTTLAEPGPRPDLTIERIGYGAGTSDFPIPNVTRILIGITAAPRETAETVVVIEANIDDMSPQHYELAMERIFGAGALDVWLTPIIMKKGRPAITVSALAPPDREGAVAEAILTETTTIGVRVRTEHRRTLPRAESTVETPYGSVGTKRAGVNGHARVRPEYRDVLRIAREQRLPILDVARVVEACIDEANAP